MAFRVTKPHTGHIWNAAYPDPVPSNQTEFDALFEAKSVSQILAEINALGLTDWATYKDDITTVLNAAPVSESFDAENQTLTVVKDWPSKALHDKHQAFLMQIDWNTVTPLIESVLTSGVEV